ncbi:MAG TPA: hypothetical protein VE397_12840, partial [Stellaceae bacterium]|nr:hypothetical protein [Stellaceae bacterium]
ALAATLPARGAAADEFDIRKADNGVSLGLGASYLDYAETAGGSTLDTEKGWLPTADLGFGILAFPQAPIPNLYFHLGAQASVGSTYYSGALCNAFGFCTPYQSKTDDDIVAVAVQLGRAFPIGRTLMLTPFGEIGYRYWARDLTGTGGYTEDYHNWDGMGGLLLQYSPVERWVLSLSGAAGQTFGADLTTQGETFNLGSKLIWRTEAKLGFRVSERVELTGSAAYESFGYGASPPDVNGFYEPDSTTHQTTLLIGIAYHFF